MLVQALFLALSHLVEGSGGDEYPHDDYHEGPEVDVPPHQRLGSYQDDQYADDYSEYTSTLRETEALIPSHSPGSAYS